MPKGVNESMADQPIGTLTRSALAPGSPSTTLQLTATNPTIDLDPSVSVAAARAMAARMAQSDGVSRYLAHNEEGGTLLIRAVTAAVAGTSGGWLDIDLVGLAERFTFSDPNHAVAIVGARSSVDASGPAAGTLTAGAQANPVDAAVRVGTVTADAIAPGAVPRRLDLYLWGASSSDVNLATAVTDAASRAASNGTAQGIQEMHAVTVDPRTWYVVRDLGTRPAGVTDGPIAPLAVDEMGVGLSFDVDPASRLVLVRGVSAQQTVNGSFQPRAPGTPGAGARTAHPRHRGGPGGISV